MWQTCTVRNTIGSEVKWPECSLIIGTGCWVQVFFSLILSTSVGLWVGIQYAGELVFETSQLRSCIQQRKTTCLLSIRKSLECVRASKLTTTNMHIYICAHVLITSLYQYSISTQLLTQLCRSKEAVWLSEFRFSSTWGIRGPIGIVNLLLYSSTPVLYILYDGSNKSFCLTLSYIPIAMNIYIS